MLANNWGCWWLIYYIVQVTNIMIKSPTIWFCIPTSFDLRFAHIRLQHFILVTRPYFKLPRNSLYQFRMDTHFYNIIILEWTNVTMGRNRVKMWVDMGPWFCSIKIWKMREIDDHFLGIVTKRAFNLMLIGS